MGRLFDLLWDYDYHRGEAAGVTRAAHLFFIFI